LAKGFYPRRRAEQVARWGAPNATLFPESSPVSRAVDQRRTVYRQFFGTRSVFPVMSILSRRFPLASRKEAIWKRFFGKRSLRSISRISQAPPGVGAQFQALLSLSHLAPTLWHPAKADKRPECPVFHGRSFPSAASKFSLAWSEAQENGKEDLLHFLPYDWFNWATRGTRFPTPVNSS
jgi:hypothetical protein